MPSWNRGHIVGQKPPLKPCEVWSIRTRLQVSGAARDLALVNFAIDSKLRCCDLVTITVGDVALSGTFRDRAVIVQRKTGRPVQFEITEQTRAAISAQRRARSQAIPNSFDEAYQSRADLHEDGKHSRGATAPGPYESTVRYLGIEVDDALAISEQIDL